ncbi:MAG: SMC-Scp complex subunit ScpB [Bacteroidota bacterium]
MEYLAQHIESLIFTSEQPIAFREIKAALEEAFETTLPEEDLRTTLDQLVERYQQESSAFEIVKIAGGYQFLTKGAYHNTVGTYLKQRVKKRLSRAALETLSIVAYKQPVTKGDIEGIRGVNCDYAMQKLLEKELVTITGRSDAPGRPLIYGTSQKFMDYFGLHDLGELPRIKEFREPDNTIGEAAPIEEEVHSEHQGQGPQNDDAIAVAIAIADLIVPIPPHDEASDTDPEGASTDPASGQADDGTRHSEAPKEPGEAETTSITEFVTETSGEFTGAADPTPADSTVEPRVESTAESTAPPDNHPTANDVVNENPTPIKED